jgi:ATP-dependent Clp protease ATP-binding subunit ClpC
MFERFTDRARRVVVLAAEEARGLNHDHIGTEHLLLGLIDEGNGIAARTLASLGISPDAVRERLQPGLQTGRQPLSGHIPFSNPAKKALDLSLSESLQMGHDYIGTEHLLLGLLAERDGLASRVLVELGADHGRVRDEVVRLLADDAGRPPS